MLQWLDKQILKRQELLAGLCVGACLLAAWLLWKTGSGAMVKPAMTIGVGGFILAKRIEKRAEFLRRRINLPNQPWLWKPEWVSRELVFTTWPQARTWWCITAAQIVISGAMLVMFAFLPARGDSTFLRPVLGYFGVFALASAGFTWRFHRRYIRQGRETRLRLISLPGFIPGKFSAVFDLENRRRAADGFRVTLSCQQANDAKSPLKRAVVASLTPVEGNVVSPKASRRNRLEVPVTIVIPPGVPASSREGEPPVVRWALEIAACGQGDDYRVEFEVPIFNDSQA